MKFLIVANGPFLSKEIIHEAKNQSNIVIALDGACNKIAKIGIMPQVILGDFDSVTEEDARVWGIRKTFAELEDHSEYYIGNYGVKIVPAKNQDLNDLAKAIDYCDRQGATAIDIVCAIGGDRMDHTLANIRVLRKAHNPQRPLRLLTEGQVLTFAKNQQVLINGEVNDYCGIVAAPAGRFSSEGLAYNGNNYELNFGFTESTSNQLKSSVAQADVCGEAIIIHPPQLSSQRHFVAKSYPERLSCLLEDQKNSLVHTSANELRHVHEIKKIVKERLHIPPKKSPYSFKKQEATIYLSAAKSSVFTSNEANILLSMSEKKFQAFNFFKQQTSSELRKKDLNELTSQVEEIYADRMTIARL